MCPVGKKYKSLWLFQYIYAKNKISKSGKIYWNGHSKYCLKIKWLTVWELEFLVKKVD